MANSDQWWSNETIAVVTGGNRGIGLEIVRQLAEKGVTTVLTSRNIEQGHLAVEQLKAKGLHNVAFHRLDVTDSRSAQELAAWIKQKYGGLDILINNAGIVSYFHDDKKQGAVDVIETNYYGVKKVIESLLLVIKPSKFGGRIINVSSRLGLLKDFRSEELKAMISNEMLSESVIDSFLKNFLADVSNGQITSKGWPTIDLEGRGPEAYSDYCVSKIALNAYTRVLAHEFLSRAYGEKVYVNVVCPGYTQTDMTLGMGNNTVEEGADTVVWLALLPPSELPSGKFLAERTEVSF
ncbi:hypothetical protein O6H91_20G044100 [Diphasiastrum complanatum]|uniref:Uncharacterized protein n=2 Tax=Diphasiastrum complanatum TaxID=34168 RepID=A0ACC2AM69_DIPCM|nr:hypothetical protein O6H91_20G002200 [Diphasiastrum complanatum]KAJ7519555.1 hypothetical protein O6H91_20G044100 [Diphasiastrum complanatum]